MARYSTWKPKFKDVVEINHLREEATEVVGKAFSSLTEDVGFDTDLASELLPFVGDYEIHNTEALLSEFYNRADFDREKSRLRRIIRAGFEKPRKTGVVSIAPDNATPLTSFYVDGDGNIYESQFMRREIRALERRRVQENVAKLKELGINFERREVIDTDTGKPMYDENRHKVYALLPKTPMQMEDYRIAIQSHPDLAVNTESFPSNAAVDLWGDVVKVSDAPYHYRGEFDYGDVYEYTRVSAKKAATTRRYFDNYRMLVDTTLPEAVSNEIDGYLDEIDSYGAETQDSLYDLIAYDEDVAGTIEFLYWDTSGSIGSKINTILTYWRSKVAPLLGMEPPDDTYEIDASAAEMGIDLGGMYPIFAEYQRRRTDEPKGKWRKEFRNGSR